MDNLVPADYSFEELDEDQINYIKVNLATTSDPMATQALFLQFFKKGVAASAILRIQRESKSEIKDLKEDIYNDLYNIPLAHAFVRLGICSSRIEFLLKNPTKIFTLREMVDVDMGLDNEGRPIIVSKEQPIKYEQVDEKELRAWVELAQKEQFLNERLKLDMLIKKVEDEGLSNTGFIPTKVNTRIDADG